MAETATYLQQQQQHNDFYHHDPENQLFSYHHLVLPTEQKPQRRLSFSTLLQKRPSLMGRKLSIFSRQKKPQLKLMIPQVAEENGVHLERMDTSASSSTEGEDSPITPTGSLYYNNNNKRSSTTSSRSLEVAITTPTTDNNTAPLMDFTGKGYSNFYIKLPNGNWMVRVRDGNRKIVGTYEIDGSMI